MTTPGGLKLVRQDILCTRLAKGVPLKEIYGARGLVKVETVYRWMQESAEFRRMYAVATLFRAERLAEQCVETACALGPDATDEHIRAARLKIETQKWLVARLDDQSRGFSGPDDLDEPAVVEVRWVDSVAPQLGQQSRPEVDGAAPGEAGTVPT